MHKKTKIKKFFKIDEYSEDNIKKEREIEETINLILLSLMYIVDIYDLYENNNFEYV